MYILIIDIHTLFPFPYHVMYETYDFHVAWRYFRMSQINYWPFHQKFCFVHYIFDLNFFKNAHAMIIMTNAWFWKICNTHNHIKLFTERSYFLVGVEEYFVMFNHWWWYYCLNTLPISFHLLLEELPCYHEVLIQKLGNKNIGVNFFLEFPLLYTIANNCLYVYTNGNSKKH